ncbi:MAG: DUF1080 domain-containing protein [Planctomycetes bacterium]|nr:DUF1080 domain-containing protein [Planctomycetota bacterium]
MKRYIKNIMFLSFLLSFQKVGAYGLQPTFTPVDPFYGDYVGVMQIGDVEFASRAMVVPEKHQDREFHYRVQIIESDGKRGTIVELFGKPENDSVTLVGERDGRWTGLIKDGVVFAERKGDRPATFHGKFTRRKSPTERLSPAKGATVLLPYKPGVKTNLDKWQNNKWKLLDDGSVEVANGGNVSLCEFGAVKMHVEFAVPYKCYDFGQGRGNSGVYLLGRYEVQVLDTYGYNTNPGNCGGIYENAPASVEHVCFPPAYWQTYDITFYPAKFGYAGKRILPAKITVLHNGTKIHEDVDIKKAPTPSSIASDEVPQGPLHLQDHGNPVRYRNIWYVPIQDARAMPKNAILTKAEYLDAIDGLLIEMQEKHAVDFASSVRYAYGHKEISDEVQNRFITFLRSDAKDEAKLSICAEMDEIARLANVDKRSLISDIQRTIDVINSPAIECRLLRTLAKLGDKKALSAVGAYLGESNPDTMYEVVEVLGDWPDISAVELLLSVMKSNTDSRCRGASFEGMLKLVRLHSDVWHAEIVRYLKVAYELSSTNAQCKAVLKLLPNYPCVEAMELGELMAKDHELALEAEVVVAAIRSSILKQKFIARASHNNNNVKSAFDEDKNSRWDTGTPMKPGMWFMLDLGSQTNFQKLTCDHNPSGDDYFRDYEIYLSDDGNNWKGPVATGQGSKATTTIDLGRKVTARYIKIVQTGSAEGNFWSIHDIVIE